MVRSKPVCNAKINIRKSDGSVKGTHALIAIDKSIEKAALTATLLCSSIRAGKKLWRLHLICTHRKARNSTIDSVNSSHKRGACQDCTDPAS